MNSLKTILQSLMIGAIILIAGMSFGTDNSYATSYSEVERNDYMGSADIISVSTGNSYSGALDINDDDWIKFTLNKGSVITMKGIANAPSEYAKIYSYFYKSDNPDNWFYANLTEYNYNLGYLNMKDNVYLSEGTYYVQLTGYSNASGEKVSYKFSFTTVPWENFKEPNNFIQSSTVMTQGKTYKGLVESTGGYNNTRDRDWFSIKPASAGTYYVTLRNNNIDSYVYVEAYKNYETKRTIFGGKDYIAAEKGRGGTYTVYLPKAKTYFAVESFADDGGKYQVSVTRKPSKVTYPDAVKYGSKGIKIKWKKKTDVTGYKVYRSTKKNSGYKLIKTIKNNNTNYYIDKNKTKGRTYYYKIRAYKYVNNYSCLGFFSRVESIKR